jgi:hypothetical protein
MIEKYKNSIKKIERRKNCVKNCMAYPSCEEIRIVESVFHYPHWRGLMEKNISFLVIK